MIHHPPWTRLEHVRNRLCKLGRRIAGHLIRLLGDGIGEAVRTTLDAFLRGRQDTPPAEIPQRHPIEDRVPPEQPADRNPQPDPLWKRFGRATLRALSWVVCELPKRHRITATLVVTTTLLTCWGSPFTDLLTLL
jgi:hypothetical protein